MQDKFLAIDQGTSATKAMVFDRQGTVLGRGKRAYGVQNRGGGVVEQDPEELFGAAVESAAEAMEGYSPKEVAALGLSVQTGSFLLWHQQTGKPLTPVISWLCRGGKPFLDSLSPQERRQFQAVVSPQLEPDGVPAKLAGVFRDHPEFYQMAAEGTLRFGTMESWLIWRLTGGRVHRSDVTNACITRLYLEKENRWNEEALKLLKIPPGIFPQVVDNDVCLGTVQTPELAGMKLQSSMGDSAAAMFGEGCWEKGQSKITYGTGASYLVNLGEEPGQLCLPDLFLGWRIKGRSHYVWEGTLSHVGSSVEWLKGLGVIASPEETESLAMALADNGGVYFLPEVPVGDAEQNLFFGTDFQTDRRHLARAVLESIAFRILDMQLELERAGLKTAGALHGDGGMAANGFLMQFQADLLNRDIICSRRPDISAYGAFLMAALGGGMLSMEEIRGMDRQSKRYRPQMPQEERRQLISRWQQMKRSFGRNRDAGS